MIMICIDGEPDDDEYADDSDQMGTFLVQHQLYEWEILVFVYGCVCFRMCFCQSDFVIELKIFLKESHFVCALL